MSEKRKLELKMGAKVSMASRIFIREELKLQLFRGLALTFEQGKSCKLAVIVKMIFSLHLLCSVISIERS